MKPTAADQLREEIAILETELALLGDGSNLQPKDQERLHEISEAIRQLRSEVQRLAKAGH